MNGDIVMGKRFKIITHNDLDGVGCGVVARSIFRKQYTFIKFVGYDNVNDVVMDSLDENWDHVFITDISVKPEVAEYIDENHREKVTLIDHHPGLDWLNEYDWAHVTSIPKGEDPGPDAPSGTSLFFEYLKLRLDLSGDMRALEFFVNNVRMYDTWIWDTIFHDEYPKQLNDYMGIVGFFDFMDEMVKKVSDGDSELLSEGAKLLLKYKQKEIDSYVKAKNKKLIKKDINGIRVGCVIAENYHSELGNKLVELNTDVKAIIIYDICRNKICIRSKKDRYVNCTDIAKTWYGGGGHELASGAQIPSHVTEFIERVLYRLYTDKLGGDCNE